MPYPYDADDLAAKTRLDTVYNGNDYDAATNPGGMGAGGHRINFEPALSDVARVAGAVGDAAGAVNTKASEAAASATSAAGSAAKMSGTSTSSVEIATGAKAFTTQSGKFFEPGRHVTIVSAANPANFMAGQVTAYSGTSLTVLVERVGGSGTFADWNIYVSGAVGLQGGIGVTGAIGAPVAVSFVFDTATTDADPGTGNMRLNNAAAASATVLYFDSNERGGASVAAWLDGFDDSNTSPRGQLHLEQTDDATKFAIFNVTGVVTDGSGYRKVGVAYVAGPGGFGAGKPVAVRFTRSGESGTGTGDVVGPASGTDGNVAAMNGSSGKAIKDSGVPANKLLRLDGAMSPAPSEAEKKQGRTSLGLNPAPEAKAAGFTIGVADIGKTFECSGTFTIAFAAAATLGSDFWCRIVSLSGTQTLDPNGAETIDGAATRALAPGSEVLVYCNGAALKTLGEDLKFDRAQVLTAAQKAQARSNAGAGMVLQVLSSRATARSIVSATPVDDTIPQIGEGSQVAAVTITPKSATSKLVFMMFAPCYTATTCTAVLALHRTGVNDAVASTWHSVTGATAQTVSFSHQIASPGTSAVEYTFRVGSNGNLYVNGTDTVRFLGGSMGCILIVMEIEE
jgi:hypothetical protein